MQTYQKIDAYVKGLKSPAMPNPKEFYYFCSTVQFKTCKAFKKYLTDKYGNLNFSVGKA
jgi:hypothetical protein